MENKYSFVELKDKDYVIDQVYIKKAIEEVKEKIKHYKKQKMWLDMTLKMSKEFSKKTKDNE